MIPFLHEDIWIHMDARDIRKELDRAYHKCAESVLAIEKGLVSRHVKGMRDMTFGDAVCSLHEQIEVLMFNVEESGLDPGDFMIAHDLLGELSLRTNDDDDDEEEYEYTVPELVGRLVCTFV